MEEWPACTTWQDHLTILKVNKQPSIPQYQSLLEPNLHQQNK